MQNHQNLFELFFLEIQNGGGKLPVLVISGINANYLAKLNENLVPL